MCTLKVKMWDYFEKYENNFKIIAAGKNNRRKNDHKMQRKKKSRRGTKKEHRTELMKIGNALLAVVENEWLHLLGNDRSQCRSIPISEIKLSKKRERERA